MKPSQEDSSFYVVASCTCQADIFGAACFFRSREAFSELELVAQT